MSEESKENNKLELPAILSERPPVRHIPGEQKRCNWCRFPLDECTCMTKCMGCGKLFEGCICNKKK